MAFIEVKCGKCGHKFWMGESDIKSCPKCGKVTTGPKAK